MSKPTDGMAVWICRWMNNKYAVTTREIALRFKVSYRQAQRYVKLLKQRGLIYNRYRKGPMYYSLTKYRRPHATKKIF